MFLAPPTYIQRTSLTSLTIMVSLFFLFALLASTTLSAPAQIIQEREPYGWSPPLADFYAAVGKRIALIRDLADQPPCDLSNASMPTAPTPLPGPGPGQVLRHVAIGRGTQVHSLLILHPFIQYPLSIRITRAPQPQPP
jgi:hypothetical protein